jgi:outer membrane receptor protein involved in Fe transport
VIQSLTRLHGDAYAYRGYFARSPEDGGVETNAYDSYWAGAEQRFVVSPSPAFSMSLGGEAQAHPHAHEYNSTEYSLTTTNISAGGQYFSHVQSFVLGALYGSVDARPVEALKLSAGARLDYYSTFGSSFNPRVAVIGRPYPGGNVKVMFGKAFRAPSIYEQTYLGIGQIPGTNLRPENAYSAEVEWSQRITPQIMATASAYTNYVRDLIALQAPPASANIAQNVNGAGCSVNEGCLQYQNTSTPVATTGAEIELRRDWKDGWMVAASYSFQRSVFLASSSLADLVALRKAAGYREVPNSPMHLASLRGAVPILSRALSLMSRLSFEGPRYDVNDTVASGVPQTRTQAAVLWDFVFSGVEAHWHLTYSVGIYNALDCRASYPVSSEFIQTSIPITGRSLLASVALSF